MRYRRYKSNVEYEPLSLSHCFPRSIWPLRDRRTIWAVLALLTLISGLYLWQASEIAAIQNHIQKLEREHEYWQWRNSELREEITRLISVTTLTERAKALGFADPEAQIYIRLEEVPPLEALGR